LSDNRQDSILNDPEFLSKLSTEELEALIEEIFFNGDSDFSDIRGILDIYSSREGVPVMDVDAAWETYKRDYMGQSEIYLTEDAGNPTQTNRSEKRARPHGRKRILRYSFIAAALIVVLFFFATPVGASLLGSFTNWTSGVFWFGDQEVHKVNAELESLHDALAVHGVTGNLAPTWLPEGFTLYDLSIMPTPKKTVIHALYYSNSGELTIQLILSTDLPSHSYEKDENNIELYRRNGVDHYIMTNSGRVNALWSIGNNECLVTGDISVDEVKHMINSIYER